ncbi:Membrane transport protein [Trueperella bernardiae]|uniref:Membrane transport protein n=1 Tax=Trueperella bernardiae TaxID=59561 RepID=A0A0W1KK59_9ACTO|nr:AEC family transporter [Trueperella bernardiae]KTF04179.1 Membrane transport protein [Trueperella bernardiae]
MGDVLLSIWTLLVYTAIGFALLKFRVVGPGADRGLSRIVFFVTMPRALTVPIDALADATVPVMMIAMGVSLASAQLRRGRDALPLAASVGFRVLLSPIVTFALAMALGLEGKQLLATMVVAVFPTANNLFAIAHRYEVGVGLVRDAVVISALASMPMLVVVAAIFYG